MSGPADLHDLVARLLANPFSRSEESWAEDETRLEHLDVRALTRLAIDRGEIAEAEKLMLAIGHVQARQNRGNPREVLPTGTLDSAIAARLPRRRAAYVRVCTASARCVESLARVLGISDEIQRVRREVWTAAFGRSLYHALFLERVARDDDVLILGETGTGKESVASSLIVATCGGPDGLAAPSSTINAAALPETLVESELFGYVKGAFTGATETRTGRILSADGGCFFLDEVGDLPAPTQVKLLRVLESDEVSPLGSDEVHRADVRFVAATHRDLQQMSDSGAFRADLYQRLAGNIIRLPPLRDRPEDIPVIGMAFVHALLPEGALDELVSISETWLRSTVTQTHAWPGNVRELQNVLRGILLGVEPKLFRKTAIDEGPENRLPAMIANTTATMEQVGDWYLTRVLEGADNNLAQASRVLDIDRSTVRRHLKRLGR